jgi:hypothetical protein
MVNYLMGLRIVSIEERDNPKTIDNVLREAPLQTDQPFGCGYYASNMQE